MSCHLPLHSVAKMINLCRVCQAGPTSIWIKYVAHIKLFIAAPNINSCFHFLSKGKVIFSALVNEESIWNGSLKRRHEGTHRRRRYVWGEPWQTLKLYLHRALTDWRKKLQQFKSPKESFDWFKIFYCNLKVFKRKLINQTSKCQIELTTLARWNRSIQENLIQNIMSSLW